MQEQWERWLPAENPESKMRKRLRVKKKKRQLKMFLKTQNQEKKPTKEQNSLKNQKDSKINLGDVQETLNGYSGVLQDGRYVHVRNKSRDKRPILEFYDRKNGEKIKIRYGEK